MSAFSQYLTENFDGTWSGNPAAPTGWVQSRVNLIGDGAPEQITSTGEKDWEQNIWTGSAWSQSIPNGTNALSPVSGSGVLWMNDYYFGPVTSAYGSRRMESPAVNLSSSVSPYVRFYLQYLEVSTANTLRVMASADGGTTWNSIMIIPANSLAGVAGWERVNVLIPAAYRTSTCKLGIEFTNFYGTQNVWIDNFSVEEYSPATITSLATGNWNATGTWTGGVVPTSDQHVVIASGHTVTVNANIARCQNMIINGTLNYSATTTQLLHVFGNLTIASGASFFAFNSTSGRRLYLGGNFSNAGTANFDVGTTATFSGIGVGTLFWLGGTPATFVNTGTITNNRIPHIYHANSGGITYNNTVSVSRLLGLYNGVVNPNGNLTIGVSAVSTTFLEERGKGSFTIAPTWGTGITTFNLSYIDGNSMATSGGFTPCNPLLLSTGEEVPVVSTVRTVSGTLTINTHGNVQLSYPMTVGTTTTGGFTLTRGILLTTNTNLLTLAAFVAGATGVDASITTPPVTHGSYVVGPLRINFPSSGTTSRNFALGVSSSFNAAAPTPNFRRSLTLATTSTAWASQTITATIEASPSGTVNSPLTSVMGARCYRLNRNGGPDLPTSATLTMPARNYTFVNSDHLVGNEDELRITQATSLTGPWTERSAGTGLSSSLISNTNYTRTSATASPGPIATLATRGEYFAWGTAPGPPPPCTTTNAGGCKCSDLISTDCDLLPDIKIARPPLLVSGTSGVIEYSQSGNGVNDGRLRISVSTTNTGFGPLEVRAQSIFVCGTDTFTGTAPSICPDNITEPRQLIRQRVYHKNNGTMTYYDRDAGSMTYHSTHGHMHVDDWGIFTLRKQTANPDPLTWPVVGNGAKLAFCLMDYGSCSTYNGHCVDDNNNVLVNANFPNYGLGGGSYGCSATVQGISSGYTDIYYQGLDGMWINIPPGTCNGDYYIVAQVDPLNYFLEANENNNIMAVPFTLTKQSGGTPVVTTSGATVFCQGDSVTLTAGPALNYVWSSGQTTQSIIVKLPGSYRVATNIGSSCQDTSAAIAVSHIGIDLTPASPSFCAGSSVQLNASTSGTNQLNYVVGVGTVANGAQAYPAPYGNYYWGARHQFLILANELSASGLTAGFINSLAFNVSAVNSAPTHNALTIKMGTTALGAITTFQTGLSTVFNPSNYQPVSGWNTHTFTSPFSWNGTSNVIVEVCFQNSAWIANGNATVQQSTTAFSSCVYYRADNSTVCGTTTVTASIAQRPNIRFGKNNSISYSWLPTSGLSNPSIYNPVANPVASTTYTVSATNNCNSTSLVPVVVNPLPTGVASSNTPACENGMLILAATGGTGYAWFGPNGFSSTSVNPVIASPSTLATGNYSVIVTDANNCTSTAITTVNVSSCPVILNIKLFIQGFYSNGAMASVIDGRNYPSLCDTAEVLLADVTPPFTITHSVRNVILTNGNGTFSIPSLSTGVNRYIVVRHRNALETWSSAPVLMQAVTSYDFTTTASKAYGNNLHQSAVGAYSLWSGDVGGVAGSVKDGKIDESDFMSISSGATSFYTGYLPQDLTGDGFVESADYSLMENNLLYLLEVIKP